MVTKTYLKQTYLCESSDSSDSSDQQPFFNIELFFFYTKNNFSQNHYFTKRLSSQKMSNCDKTQKLKLLQNSNCDKTQMVTKLKNSNCDKTQILKFSQN